MPKQQTIREELISVAEIKQKSGEADTKFLGRLVNAVGELPDADWEGLSKGAQDWYNEACDSLEKGGDFPAFPDEEAPAEEAKSTKRRAAAKDEPEDDDAGNEPKKGDKVKVITKRGKEFTGTVLKITDDELVLDTDDGEEEFDRDRLESIEPVKASGGKKSSAKDEPEAYEPKKGDEVVLVNSRDQEFTGTVVEVDNKEGVIVLDVDGKDKEFSLDKVKSVEPLKGKGKAAAKDEAEDKGSSRRRTASKDDAEDKPAAAAKRVTKDENDGVSPSARARELIIEDLEAGVDDIIKQLKKEDLVFKENTIQLVYKDTHKVIEALKKAKKLK